MQTYIYPPEAIGLFVTDHVEAMLAYWDKDLICRFANKAYGSWFGKSPVEMVGKMTLPELLGPIYLLNKEFIEGALLGERQTFERTITRPDGRASFSLANYYPHLEGNLVRGFVAHVVDISEVKVLQQELSDSQQTATNQSQQLQEFASLATHNLGNHVQSLSGLISLLDEADSDDFRQILITKLKNLSGSFSDTLKQIIHKLPVENIRPQA